MPPHRVTRGPPPYCLGQALQHVLLTLEELADAQGDATWGRFAEAMHDARGVLLAAFGPPPTPRSRPPAWPLVPRGVALRRRRSR